MTVGSLVGYPCDDMYSAEYEVCKNEFTMLAV